MVPGFPQLGAPPRLGKVRRLYQPSVPTKPPTPVSAAVTREYPPDRIAIRVDAPNGSSARWAEDEPDPWNVLSNIVIEDEMPGGDKSLTGTLGRNPQLKWSEDEAYADITAYQPGVSKIFEGFLDKAPDVSGEQMSINPAALGYQSILEDDKAQAVGILNSDLNAWTGPSGERKRVLLEAHQPAKFEPSVVSGVLYTSLRLALQDAWDGTNTLPRCEAWFDAGSGVRIAAIFGDWVNGDPYSHNTNFILNVFACQDEKAAVGLDSSGDYFVTTSGHISQGSAFGGFYNDRYGGLLWYYPSGPAGVEGVEWPVDIINLKVLGNFPGCAGYQGVWPHIGFTNKQILEYVIPLAGGGLEARPEDIDSDGFLIEHAWYGERGPTSEIVHDVLKYSLWDWFFRNGKRFHVKQPGTYNKFWKAYTRESNLNEVGIDSQELWTEVIVKFQDVSGKTMYVGPTGSGSEVESELLRLNDPELAANRAGRKRRALLDMKGISNPAQAIEVGVRFLEEALLINHAGSASLTGYVMDHYGVFWPAACVKSGDWVSFVDAADTGYRKIVNRKYNHNNRAAEIDIDAPPSGMEALLERLQAVLIPLGVS